MNNEFDLLMQMLEADRSRDQTNAIVEYVGVDKRRMRALMDLFFNDNWRYNQWAAWPVGFVGRKHPELIEPYLTKMVKCLDDAKHDAVVRNTLRIFEEIQIPEALEGELFDKSFNFLTQPKYPVAIRVFAMTVLSRIAPKYPDLIPELLAEIQEHMPHGSAAFKSRGKKVIKQLEKYMM